MNRTTQILNIIFIYCFVNLFFCLKKNSTFFKNIPLFIKFEVKEPVVDRVPYYDWGSIKCYFLCRIISLFRCSTSQNLQNFNVHY